MVKEIVAVEAGRDYRRSGWIMGTVVVEPIPLSRKRWYSGLPGRVTALENGGSG